MTLFMIKRVAMIALGGLLVGCGGLDGILASYQDGASIMTGRYVAPLLAGSPRQTRGCSDQRCAALDELEQVGYQRARARQITWTRLVDGFYEGRKRLYPESNDDSFVFEYQAFQRALAEQLDAGRVSEAQWAYLVERKLGELRERERSGTSVCNTTNIGTPFAPNYQTVCR